MIKLAIVLFCVVAGSWLWSLLARRHLRHIKQYESYSSAFYKASGIVLKNENLPNDILLMIAFMTYKMPRRSSAREFLWSIWNSRSEPASLKDKYDTINNFFRDHPEAEEPFELACRSAMRALSYRSLFAGFLIRKLFLFDDADSHERPAQLVLQAKSRTNDVEKLVLAGASLRPAHC